jgi:hemoglobin
MSEQSLYQRIGGYDAIAAAVDDALARLLSDAAVKAYFDHMSLDETRKLRQHFIDFLVEAAGGPAYYIGRDMRTTHVGMGITDAQWDAFVADISSTLDHLQVPERECSEVLTLMGTLKQEIVESSAA